MFFFLSNVFVQYCLIESVDVCCTAVPILSLDVKTLTRSYSLRSDKISLPNALASFSWAGAAGHYLHQPQQTTDTRKQ